MRFLKVFLSTLVFIFIILNAFLNGLDPCLERVYANVNSEEEDIRQRLIEEILTLDARALALQKEVNKLTEENHKLKISLEKKRSELVLLDEDFRDNQDQLSQWVLFSFKGGIGDLISVLVGAEDLGDLFRRFDNIMFFLEYYNNIIVETKGLIHRRKQEELSIMQKQREIQNLEEQTRAALKKVTQTIEDKQRELERARLVLKDATFLSEISENWQETLPSLDHLLKNLSRLPWSSISPDNLKINYFALSARAEFHDNSVTKTLLSKDEKLKNVFFTFSPEGITVSEKNVGSSSPIYSITCTIELTKDQKIKFTPTRVDFSGVTLPSKVIKELMADYDTVFTPPPLPYDLRITSVLTEHGKLTMNFKK